MLRAGHQDRAQLGRAERDGQIRTDRFTLHGPRRAVDAGGDVDRHHRHVGLVHARDRRGPVVLRHATEPRPEDRIHRDVRAGELAPEGMFVERPHADARDLGQAPGVRGRRFAELVGVLERYDGRPHAGVSEAARRDEPVAAVVALAADDHRPAPIRAAGELARGPRYRAARPLHQHLGRDALRLRVAVEGGCLIGGQDRLHRTAIANATAFVRSCVNVISTSVTPMASARRLALPSRRIAGAPEGCRVTLMSCHRRPR